MKINHERNIIYVKGGIPGPYGSWVEISDCLVRPNTHPLPFPTHLEGGEKMPEYTHWQYGDPIAKKRELDWDLKVLETKKSLAQAQQGKGGKFVFMPYVFVTSLCRRRHGRRRIIRRFSQLFFLLFKPFQQYQLSGHCVYYSDANTRYTMECKYTMG
jgi:hypothetical protein